MGCIQSMSGRRNCCDNACIENYFCHLKTEILFFSSPRTLEVLNNPYQTTFVITRQHKFKINKV